MARQLLMGPGLGAICHQRGLLPLHASAVRVGSRCVAFVGSSGAGKSTLAGLLSMRGYTVLADDLSVLEIREDLGLVLAHRGASSLRLRSDSVEALALRSTRAPGGLPPLNKHSVDLPPEAVEPLPLHSVYALHHTSPGESPRIEPLKAFNALRVVLENVYTPGDDARDGMVEQVFRLSAAIAQAARIRRMVRPLDYGRAQEVVDGLIADWSQGDQEKWSCR